jgi:hypothetical protein
MTETPKPLRNSKSATECGEVLKRELHPKKFYFGETLFKGIADSLSETQWANYTTMLAFMKRHMDDPGWLGIAHGMIKGKTVVFLGENADGFDRHGKQNSDFTIAKASHFNKSLE